MRTPLWILCWRWSAANPKRSPASGAISTAWSSCEALVAVPQCALCPARHLAAPRCSLCARALRPLYMWWAVGGPHASACRIAEAGVAWLARSSPPRVPASHPPPTAQRGTSLRLDAPCVRAPCARCTRGGLSGALMRQHAQWQGLAWRSRLAAAPRECRLSDCSTDVCSSAISLRLSAPCVHAPCARCTCGGLSGALMRQPAQWQGLAWRGWLAAAPHVYRARQAPPPPPSAGPRPPPGRPLFRAPAPPRTRVGDRGPR